MIRVPVPPPPVHYEADVRIPGLAFLDTTPCPSRKDWEQYSYWSKIHSSLYDSLQGICSYCASFTPKRTRFTQASVDHTSIDHFIPKGKAAALAYEWTNFRLCRARLNNRKGNYEDVLDPYAIHDGWFCLDFSTFLLFPNPDIPEDRQRQVKDSIARLELNTDDIYVNERARAVYGFAAEKLSLEELARMYPFIAKEVVSQEFIDIHLPIIKTILSNPRVRDALIV